jgi:DNA-binding GntR family transcriptional regulator
VRGHSGTLRNQAYSYIQKKILSGELPVGQQVSEASLAREIGISRTPVREAIQQLVREGLVEQVPRLGTLVKALDRRDVVELYELREALEPFAVGHAAQRIGAADLARCDRLCDEIHRLNEEARQSGVERLGGAKLLRFLAADMGFHMILVRAAGNERIQKIVADSRVLIRIFNTHRQEHDHKILDETEQFHSQILKAVREHDSDRARALMNEHIATSKRETLEFIDRGSGAADQPTTLGLPEDLLKELGSIVDTTETS